MEFVIPKFTETQVKPTFPRWISKRKFLRELDQMPTKSKKHDWTENFWLLMINYIKFYHL